MNIIKPLALSACLAALTTPALAQQCGSEFSSWLDDVRAEARQKGVSDRAIATLNDARIDEKVLARDRKQSVFTLSFADFAKRLISQNRLDNGRANMKRYASVFAKAKAEYGVPPQVITAFWGLETDYGGFQGDFNTLNALVTLAHDCRRPELFRPQLIALLELFDKGLINPGVTGAWAGEIGQLQLLPEDILKLGTDGDGDGVVDLKRSKADAILTSARFINSLGWHADEPWVEEVVVPQDLDWAKMDRLNLKTRKQWADLGVTYRNAPLPQDGLEAGMLTPMGRKGPAFLAYKNFDVYIEWNQSLVYTLTAAYFANRLGGAPRFDLRNPEPGLDGDQMKLLQTRLQSRGFDVGKVDGILGVKTRAAVKAEQSRLGFPADGWPTPQLLQAL